MNFEKIEHSLLKDISRFAIDGVVIDSVMFYISKLNLEINNFSCGRILVRPCLQQQSKWVSYLPMSGKQSFIDLLTNYNYLTSQ